MSNPPAPAKAAPLGLLAAVLLISCAAIAYEILLMRVLSIVQWHHFAWMIISLALLGYGASGSAIALARGWLEPRFESAFALSALMFSVSMIVCLWLGQRIPFNALEIIWDPRQWAHLAGLYLLFMVPFFFAASCIGMAFTCRRELVDRIYFFDLIGAGLGAALLIAALFIWLPQSVAIGLAALALAASALAGRAAPRRRGLAVAQVLWLTREAAKGQPQVARNGLFQHSLDRGTPAQALPLAIHAGGAAVTRPARLVGLAGRGVAPEGLLQLLQDAPPQGRPGGPGELDQR